jgi:hypothetical protein
VPRPTLAPAAFMQPIAAIPGQTYVGHILQVGDQMVVQNCGGTLIRHELPNLVAGQHELLKPGTSVMIEYTNYLWKVAS